MMRFVPLASAIALAATLAACSNSPTAPSAVTGTTTSTLEAYSNHDSGSGSFSLTDTSFVSAASQSYQFHINLGRLVEDNGDHPMVKSFARQMNKVHRRRLEHLREIAGGAVARTITLSSTQQASVSDLNRLTGSMLDRRYLQLMSTELPATIARHQQQAAAGSSTALRNHAADLARRLGDLLTVLRGLVTFVK